MIYLREMGLREREKGRDRDSAVGVNVEWEGMEWVCREGREEVNKHWLYLQTITDTSRMIGRER